MRENVQLRKELGGEVRERIEKVKGREYRCHCGHTSYARPILGYKHDGGTPDADGQKWWMFVVCPACGHQFSLGKLKHKYTDSE